MMTDTISALSKEQQEEARTAARKAMLAMINAHVRLLCYEGGSDTGLKTAVDIEHVISYLQEVREKVIHLHK